MNNITVGTVIVAIGIAVMALVLFSALRSIYVIKIGSIIFYQLLSYGHKATVC